MDTEYTVEQFLAVYDQFCTVKIAKIQNAINRAFTVTPKTIWGEKWEQGIELYTAHVLTSSWQQMTQLVSDASAVASGGRSGGANGGSGDFLDTTSFGQAYKQLRSTLPVSGFSF